MLHYWAETGQQPREIPYFDLINPIVDFVHIARGFGIRASRIEKADDLGPAIREAFAAGQPWLIDVVIEGSVREEMRATVRAHSGV